MSDPPSDPNRGRSGAATDTDPDPRAAGADEEPDPDRGRVDTDSTGRAPVGATTLKGLSGVVGVLGLWLAASPFVYDASRVALWNNLVIGGAVVLSAGYTLYRLSEAHRPTLGARAWRRCSGCGRSSPRSCCRSRATG
jgi:hypothetical protein